jgi:hypothetical protein
MFKSSWHILLLTLGILIIDLFPSFFTIPGTYFLLDTGFTPFTQMRGLFEVTLYWHITHMLSYVFWYALWSKIYFLWVVWVWILTWVMISRLVWKLFPEFRWKTLGIIGIMGAVYNPFIYERIISQTGIALGSYMLIIGRIQFTLQFD